MCLYKYNNIYIASSSFLRVFSLTCALLALGCPTTALWMPADKHPYQRGNKPLERLSGGSALMLCVIFSLDWACPCWTESPVRGLGRSTTRFWWSDGKVIDCNLKSRQNGSERVWQLCDGLCSSLVVASAVCMELGVLFWGHGLQIVRLIVVQRPLVMDVQPVKCKVWLISLPAKIIANKAMNGRPFSFDFSKLDFPSARLHVFVWVHKMCNIVCICLYSGFVRHKEGFSMLCAQKIRIHETPYFSGQVWDVVDTQGTVIDSSYNLLTRYPQCAAVCLFKAIYAPFVRVYNLACKMVNDGICSVSSVNVLHNGIMSAIHWIICRQVDRLIAARAILIQYFHIV